MRENKEKRKKQKTLKPRFGKLSCFMAKTHFWTFKS